MARHLLLKGVDLAVGPMPVVLGTETFDSLDQYAPVPRTIEDGHVAVSRHVAPEPPQVRLRRLLVARRRDRHDAVEARIQTARDPADGAALAGGIVALEDQHDRALVILVRAWWGSNGGFRYDKLMTIWVTRSGQGYTGTVGVANPAGVAAGDYANLFQNNMQVILDPSQNTYVIGIKRSQIDDDGNMRAIAAVGSNQFWNDDIPNSGAGTIEDAGVQPAAVYSATAITFEHILVGESTDGSITITATNEAGLEVTSIALTEPDDALTITTKPALPATLAQGQELEVAVTYAPTKSGFIAADLLITTNDALNPTQNVVLSGSTLTQWPRMSVSNIDFDVVEVGDTNTVPVTIYPLNRAGLTIGGLFIDTTSGGGSGHFSLSDVGTLPISLDEGDSIVVQISYHPQRSGRVDQAMIIQVREADGSLRDGDWVLLNGRAVDGVMPAATVSSDNVDFGEVKVGNTS